LQVWWAGDALSLHDRGKGATSDGSGNGFLSNAPFDLSAPRDGAEMS